MLPPMPATIAKRRQKLKNLKQRILGDIKRKRANLEKRFGATVLTPFIAHLRWHATSYRSQAIQLAPDVVHAHDLYTLLAGRQIAEATGAILVYDSHELEVGRNGNFSRWERMLRARSERWLIKRCNAVITVCDSIADYLADMYRIPRPVVVLNAPSAEKQRLDLEHASSGDVRSCIGLTDDTPLAVYVGKVTIHRGLEQCVAALAHAPTLHVATVGPRVPSIEAELSRIAVSLGVRERLHFVDPVPHKEVTPFVQTASLSLITIQNVCLSYKFCFPNKLLESLMAGVPVVAGRLVELERMVERTKAGVIVDETDPVAIAEGIMTVLEDRARYAPDGQLIQWLIDNFSWELQSDKLVGLYSRFPAPNAETSKQRLQDAIATH